MKFLEIPILAQLTECLHGAQSIGGESKIYGKIEAYSCKRAGSDKKLYKSLDQQYQVELSKSPETDLSSSPFGPLSESGSRRTLISLISLLNAAFPDYDFCNLRPEQFRKEASLHMIVNSINTTLAAALPNYNTDLCPKLWNVLENEIVPKECDIYSYIPDFDSDPYAEAGAVWSFNYLFYNKKLKRILFFTCYAISKMSVGKSIASDDMISTEGGVWMEEEMEF